MTRYGLTPDVLDRAFPFHVACDEELVVTQVGPSLVRIAPDVVPGRRLVDLFSLSRTAGAMTQDDLAAACGQLVLLGHRSSRALFRGQFERLGPPGYWVFLGTPWFHTAEALEGSGLSLNDFAPHDAIGESLVIGQTQQMAVNDLERLAGRLAEQRERLRRTEALYRSAIAAANAVPYQEEFASDRYTYLGDGIVQLTGYPASELRPSRLRELASAPTGGNDVDTGNPRDGHVLRRRHDYRIRTRDGEERWVSDAAVMISGPSGKPTGAIGIIQDITERTRAEQRLRESEEQARRLALVVARTDNGVVLTDSARRIEWVNEGFMRITGYPAEEAIGRSPGELLQGVDSDPATVARVRAALDAAEAVSFEILNYRRDGQRYWVETRIQPMLAADGALTGFMAIQADITARKDYEQRLSSLSRELDAILKLVPDGVVAFDAGGRVSYCNPAFERLTGLLTAQVRGMGSTGLDAALAELAAADQRPAPVASLGDDEADVIRLERPHPSVIARTVREVRGDFGGAGQRVIYLRDVTRETEIDRMKSEFLSLAAHELRTPMSSVHGFAELLMSRDYDATTSRSIAQTIHRQSSLLVQMVNELLDIARIESRRGHDFVLQAQPLGPIVRGTIAALLVPGDQRKVDDGALPEETPLVEVDAAKLGQAITNVLSNAYKYSRGRGEIRVSLPSREFQGRREVGVRVSDDGVGMSAEQVARVFERFYRADPSSGIPGTGLGMSLVKEIVEIMGGSVGVESQPGQGTTVTLWLPVCTGTAQEPAVAREVAPA